MRLLLIHDNKIPPWWGEWIVHQIYQMFDTQPEAQVSIFEPLFYSFFCKNFNFIFLIYRLIKFRPQIIHIHAIYSFVGISAYFFCFLFAPKSPIVLTIHSQRYFFLIDNKNIFIRYMRYVYVFLEALSIYFFVKTITVPSKFYLNYARKNLFYKNKKLFYFPNFEYPCKKRVYKNWSPRHFGFIGELNYNKWFHLLLDAWKTFKNQNPFNQDKLMVAGVGIFSQDVMALSQNKNMNISYLGWVHDNNTFMKNIDFLIMPSVWIENNPLVGIKALLSWIPFFASNRWWLPELTTVTFDPDKIDDLIFLISSPDVLKNTINPKNFTKEFFFKNLKKIYWTTSLK